MEKLILNTKGEMKYRLTFIGCGIVLMIIGMIFFVIAAETSNTDMKNVGLLGCGCSIGFGIFAILYSFIHCSGYIAIYENHCEGKGIQGKGVKNFYLSNNQVISVTSESYYLCLHTDIGEFKIICSQKYHMQAMSYFTTRSI